MVAAKDIIELAGNFCNRRGSDFSLGFYQYLGNTAFAHFFRIFLEISCAPFAIRQG
jgi:hypothetical protein